MKKFISVVWKHLVCLSIVIAAAAPAQTYLGNFVNYDADSASVTVRTDSAEVRIFFYSDDIVRLDYLPAGASTVDSSFVVIRNPAKNVQRKINEFDSVLVIRSAGITLRIQKFPVRFSFIDSLGRTILSEPRSGGAAFNHDSRILRFTMNPDDHFYGTGERGTSLDKRGQKFVSYNTQVGGYSEPLETMNLNVPFVTTTSGYALFIDNTYKGVFDFGATDTSVFSYEAEGGELSYYVIAVPTIPEQLEKYTWLTGRQPLPPRWIFGFTQSKNRYADEKEARSVVRTMREKKFPCDAIVLDLAWFKNMGDLSWNEPAWPDHEKMIGDFLTKGIKTILITEPYIVQPSKNFVEADARGFLSKDSTGRTHLLEKWWSCGGCNASLLDMTDPDAQHWWWQKHLAAFGKNVTGIWTDLGEPEKHPETMLHHLGNASKVHNIFNLLWAKTIFDGFNQLHPNERVVNLTRSGFAGIQRYGVLPWSGDVARSFGGLAVQVPMLLNMGMSGIAYHNSDIGGYARNPTTPELYIRWMQYGVFCPVTRAHGAGENVNGSPTEPWKFGKEAEKICRDFLRMRYRLLPYNYSLAFQNYSMGLPLARPLFWLDASDPKLFNESSSYMWGDAFLVSPVVSAGQREKELYLPKGNWINFWTEEIIQGGKNVVVPAPLDRIPLFVKAGSIIPMGEEMDYSDERKLDTLTIHIYPDLVNEKEISYALYEDDGATPGYQKGEYSITTFSQTFFIDRGKTSLKILLSPFHGTYRGKISQRKYFFVIHSIDEQPVMVICNGKQAVRGRSYSQFRSDGASFSYDARTHKVFVQLFTSTERANEILVFLRKSKM